MSQLADKGRRGGEDGECHVFRTKDEFSTSLQLLILNGLNVSHLQEKKIAAQAVASEAEAKK